MGEGESDYQPTATRRALQFAFAVLVMLAWYGTHSDDFFSLAFVVYFVVVLVLSTTAMIMWDRRFSRRSTR